MNFRNTWYVIERNNHYETISHEAIQEHKRLVRLAIADTKAKLDAR